MGKKLGIGMTVLVLTGLAAISSAEAGVRVSVGFGGCGYGGFYGFYGPRGCGPGWYSRPYPYFCGYYYAPPVVYTVPVATAPLYSEGYVNNYEATPAHNSSRPARTVTTSQEDSDSSQAPYGFMSGPGQVKSPWSDFTISSGGKSSGQVVYDANNGKAFRIP